MNVVEKRFRITGTTPLLGSVALDKEVYTNYLATKGKTAEEKTRALGDVDGVMDADEKGVTGFYRNESGLVVKAYQIKGFFKGAAKALKDQIGLASYVSKIDNLVFVAEKDIPIMRDGEQIVDPDGFLERPLRGETAQGPRVSLAKSEMVDEGWTLEFTVKVLENAKTAKSRALDMDVVEELLSYGELKGLLQWRNGGYGSFTVEEVA